MFHPKKKIFTCVLTLIGLVGGSILSISSTVYADTVPKNPQNQQQTMNQTRMNHQMLFQMGIPNQQSKQISQQHNQMPIQQLGQQANQQQSLFNIISAVASILDVEEKTIIDSLMSGKTLAEIAESYGVSEDTLLSKLKALIITAIDNAETAGTITETQATEMESQLTTRLTEAIEGTFGNSVSDSSSNSISTPDDLTATAESSSEILLDWDSVDDATSYYVYRSTSSSGTYSKIATVTTSSYSDDDLSEDTTYYYKVKAVNSTGTSVSSSIAHATTDEE